MMELIAVEVIGHDVKRRTADRYSFVSSRWLHSDSITIVANFYK